MCVPDPHTFDFCGLAVVKGAHLHTVERAKMARLTQRTVSMTSGDCAPQANHEDDSASQDREHKRARDD